MAKETPKDSGPILAAAKAAPAVDTPAYHELTAEERTQIVADQRFKGPARFRCGHRDCPSVIVAAASPEEARIRYQELCGIRSSENPFSVEAV